MLVGFMLCVHDVFKFLYFIPDILVIETRRRGGRFGGYRYGYGHGSGNPYPNPYPWDPYPSTCRVSHTHVKHYSGEVRKGDRKEWLNV